MRFDIITIFPEIFDSYFNKSIIKRAQKSGKVKIKIWNLRDFAKDKYKKVDDRPFGGGPGMVIKIEPLVRVLERVKGPAFAEATAGKQGSRVKNENTLIILFSANGKQFDAKLSRNFAKNQNRIIMICGHYEGIDERIKNVLHASGFMIHEVSIGPYVLTGGELPAMVVADAISRHIPGVLGKTESLEEKRHGIGVPVYTRPEIFKFKKKEYGVPKVLLSGDHKKIEEWRAKHRK